MVRALEDIFHDDMNAHYKASLFRIDLSHKGDKVSTIKWLKVGFSRSVISILR